MSKPRTVFDDVWNEVEGNWHRVLREKYAATKCTREVLAMVTDDLGAMEAIPWDVAECASQYMFSLAKIRTRCEEFLNDLNRGLI